MICFGNILIFQHLLIWQKNYLKQKIKRKTVSLQNKSKTEKMSKEEIKNEKPNDISEIINEILDFNKEI